jgi:hypothetical protein
MEANVRVRVHRPLLLPDQGGRPARALHGLITTTAERIDLEAAGIRRSALNTAEAFSGARLELLEFPDGRRLVAKHLPADGDWLTRATGGRDRPRRLWETGVLDRVDAVSDHTVVAMQTVDDHTVVLMRDASNELLPPRVTVTRATSKLLLSRLANMHEHLAGTSADDLCPIAARYAMFAPDVHATDTGVGRHPMADRIVHGWEVFEAHVAADVAHAVFAVHRAPERLVSRLAGLPATLLHGDAKLENLGLSRDGRLVAIDWGDLTGVGPREIDVAWYALKAAARIGCSPADLFADYEAAASERLDLTALDVVCVGSLAQMGFRLALSAYDTGPEPPEVARELLDWWIDRTRSALGRLSADRWLS